ncbi:MAG: type II toxin-antitoxin system RelE/ParE family toxin [Rhodoluna sp.]
MSEQVLGFLDNQPESNLLRVLKATDALREKGPMLGRPFVDSVKGSAIHNLKELRVSSSRDGAIRILFCFSPKRIALLLVAGDKSNNWSGWYERAIEQAEEEYDRFLEN